MNRSLGSLVACCVVIGGCNYEYYDDCGGDEALAGARSAGRVPLGAPGENDQGGRGEPTGGDDAGESSGGSHGGREANGGAAPTSDGGRGGAGGDSQSAEPAAISCEAEADCARGYNCEQSSCVAADAETCPELGSEAACGQRLDCAAIYAGVDCSCGPDCECVGGEPGCVCESFEFFRCEAADGS